ncbi:MAG TPA: hypothetical protein PK535_10835, partial [Synergistaceae bacterium]|nr:hypothetical protein [Synergistaceae bacterium]
MKRLKTWLGPLLLAGAFLYFLYSLLPVWRPRLEEFWREAGGRADWSCLILSALCLFTGYYLAPMAWRNILGALKIPTIERDSVRRNWFITQMGSYIPGRLWMVLGRIAFLNSNGAGSVKATTALILENIYLVAALGLLTA